MDFNISKSWLLRTPDTEDQMPVSAGSLVFDLRADANETTGLVAEHKATSYHDQFMSEVDSLNDSLSGEEGDDV